MFAIKDIVEGVTKAGLDKIVEEVQKPKIIENAQTTDADRADFKRIMESRLRDETSGSNK